MFYVSLNNYQVVVIEGQNSDPINFTVPFSHQWISFQFEKL